MKALEEVQDNTEMLKDLKDQVQENVDKGKDFFQIIQDVKQEIPMDAIAAARYEIYFFY